jgi:predicted dehydrogenase
MGARRTFRGALIGCGFFAENHMHGWAEAEGAAIVAVCDRDRARAERFAALFGVPAVYDDAAAMLAAERPDFCDVATTVESHRALVELALAHGAATICQKPFAESYADGLAMVEAAERAGKPLLVHENFRWERPLMALQRQLAAGAIGAPTFARLSFRHGYDVYANQPYLATTKRFALMDVGLHLFDVARFLVGDALDIHCRTQSVKPGILGEDMFLATTRHANGVVAAIDCSFFSKIVPDPFPQTTAWVEGTEGTLELDANYRLHLSRDGERITTDEEPDVPAWGAKPWHAVQDSVAAFERHVVEVLRGEAEPQPSGRHNLATLALALAAYESAATGRSVRLADFVAAGAVPAG